MTRKTRRALEWTESGWDATILRDMLRSVFSTHGAWSIRHEKLYHIVGRHPTLPGCMTLACRGGWLRCRHPVPREHHAGSDVCESCRRSMLRRSLERVDCLACLAQTELR